MKQSAIAALVAALLCFSHTASACSLPGDGEGHGPALSYYAISDTQMLDAVTGLTWERKTLGNYQHVYSGADAQAYVNSLGPGWRLPNAKELMSILNFNVRWPAINQNIFGPLVPVSQTSEDWYWTSASGPGGLWSVDFWNGLIYSNNGSQLYVRAVKGTPVSCFPGDGISGRSLSYTDNGDGTVTDNVTGLMWSKTTGTIGQIPANPPVTDVNNTYTWDQANSTFITYMNAAAVGGHADWRLPDIKELQSINDYSRKGPSISPIFGPSQFAFYWSSTPHTGSNTCAWGVGFGGGGNVYHDNRPDLNYVRAVRG